MTNVFQSTHTADKNHLKRILQMHGYSACLEALVLLHDHYTSCPFKYDSYEDFVVKLNDVITFKTRADSSIISPDLADAAIKILMNGELKRPGERSNCNEDEPNNQTDKPIILEPPIPLTVAVKIRNVTQEQCVVHKSADGLAKQTDDFNIHYKFLHKRLSSLPAFGENFQLTSLDKLVCSTQPSIRCICFGLLIKDIHKIDGYLLIDNTQRVPVRITPDTVFRNRLFYTNCIVIIEGVYVNPDDILYAANVGLPPVLLDPIQNKSLVCRDDKLVVMLREVYLDDEDVCKSLELLFLGYNSMEDPPLVFLLIGNFTRDAYLPNEFRKHAKKLIRFIRICENLKHSHFVFVPGSRDGCIKFSGELKENHTMPKSNLLKEHIPINLLQLSGFEHVHLATNPCHIYLNDRLITVVSHPYLKQLKNYLLHDLSDHQQEFMQAASKIMLTNAHLTAGVANTFYTSMNMWHMPDLLVLADTEALGNKYDISLSKSDSASFATLPSFSQQYNQFKVYYIKTGDVEDSQVSNEAVEDISES